MMTFFHERNPYTTFWMEAVRASSYLAIALYTTTLLGPYTTVTCVGPSVLPYSDINKTIREQFFKQVFLTGLKTKLESDGFQRNNSTNNGKPSSAQQSPSTTHTPNPITAPSRHISEKGSIRSDISIPNLVYSQSEEKNVLTFKFKPKTVKSKNLVNRINLWLYVWTKENKDKAPSSPSSSVSSSSPSPTTRDLKGDDQRDRRKGKRIKIRVFLSNVNGTRGPRIAELKTRIDGSTWGKLGLPVSLINTLAESDSNNTLRLRIECKRCSGKTQVILPGNGDPKKCRQRKGMKKKKDGRMHRWRKHCVKSGNTDEKLFPFIVIEEKAKSSSGRFKRSMDFPRCAMSVSCNNRAGSNTGVDGEIPSQGNLSVNGNNNYCCLAQTHIEFSDLNLDYVIVHPSGFEYATCINGGRNVMSATTSGTDNHIRGIADLISEKIRRYEQINSQNRLQIGHIHTDAGHSSGHRHQPPQHHHHHQQQQYSHQQRGAQHRRYNHKRSRLKMADVCEPTESNNLDIVYLTVEHKITHIQLPNLLVTRCGCKYGLPFVKD